MESDVSGLRKVTDDISITQLELETKIKALKVELFFMEKTNKQTNRQTNKKPRGRSKWSTNQIATSGLMVDLGAPKSQDLSKIMVDTQTQYDELAQKN